MKAAEALLRVELAMVGVHEVGFNNRGPQVEEIQKADDLPGGGYAWCVSTKQFAADLLGFKLPSQTASVGFLEKAYASAGWLLDEPVRGADGFWALDVGTWPDHLISVQRVVKSSGDSWKIETVEGNTSKGFGSISDGGGLYERERIIPKGAIRWGLAKGNIPDAEVEAVLAAVALARKQGKIVSPSLVERLRAKLATKEPPEEALYWLWLRWRLGEGEFRKHGPHNPAKRPKVLPRKVPRAWWERATAFLYLRRWPPE